MPLKMSVLMSGDTQECGDGKRWWPARYMQWNDGSFTTRLRDAWMVFRGRAEAVVWDWDEH